MNQSWYKFLTEKKEKDKEVGTNFVDLSNDVCYSNQQPWLAIQVGSTLVSLKLKHSDTIITTMYSITF